MSLTPRSGSVQPPTEVLFFRELAHAALKAGDEATHAAWAVLRAWDSSSNQGAGLFQRSTARAVIAHGLGVAARQAQRILAAGDGRYWQLSEDKIRLCSAQSVARGAGIERVTRPHCIGLVDLT